jgi:hypothetical protein
VTSKKVRNGSLIAMELLTGRWKAGDPTPVKYAEERRKSIRAKEKKRCGEEQDEHFRQNK